MTTDTQTDYENPWTYNGEVFDSDCIQDYFGFVYHIHCNKTNRDYIGRKYFWSFRTPRGKSRKVKSESDWKKYYGSCPELKVRVLKLKHQLHVDHVRHDMDIKGLAHKYLDEVLHILDEFRY